MHKSIQKPIETIWNGYRFRSRLEARWAVFFETCGFKWEYEIEGYNLKDLGPYLPDFWINDLKLWVEIKPNGTIRDGDYSESLLKIQALKQEVGYPACLIEGVPGDEKIYLFYEETTDSSGGNAFTEEAEWVSCNGIITLDLNRGRDHWVYTQDFSKELPWFTYYQSFPSFKLPVMIAYEAARSARFEHNEKP